VGNVGWKSENLKSKRASLNYAFNRIKIRYLAEDKIPTKEIMKKGRSDSRKPGSIE
tara:strand:+ start:5168 stop:5335 length:168 start_codon:yes stop_codon:yes gene_type:complete